jgi:endoglucanase
MKTEHSTQPGFFSRKLIIILSSFICMCVGSITGQTMFSKGVNLSNWFQGYSVNDIQFSKYSRQDLQNIKNLGCDVIRLPINLHFMTSGTPDYIINPVFFSMLDSIVNWAEELDINLILDNHTFDPAVNTDPTVGDILVKVWSQMALHFKEHSALIKYEILNEPHGITTLVWSGIQQRAIDAIRAADTKHTIIVGASGWNTYNEMALLPEYSDTNLIYTFHFYDPFMFTHQGASWVSPSMVPLAGVPFPYNPANMPVCPPSLLGSWVESSLNNYSNDGTVANIKKLIDIAVNFKKSRNVPVYCGEFGVYNLNSNNSDRVYWYDSVRSYLESKGISWTTWDYQGGFGLFKKGSDELFDHDLNVPLLQALGLNIPAQTTYIERPDSIGFSIYSDYIEKYINESNSGNSGYDYYFTQHPNNGTYCLAWSGADQYSYIGFDFVPNRDLSNLVPGNYAVDFFVRGDSPGSDFEIRFIDTKTTDPNDHPWRMHYKIIENSERTWDKKWHHIWIPLKDFTEMGSWDNNQWYNPVGLFDWKAVDRFDIVAESASLSGKEFWFDNILISNLDSSIVWDNTILNNQLIATDYSKEWLRLFPNPVGEILTIQYNQTEPADVIIKLTDILGQPVFTIKINNQQAGNYYYYWNRRNPEFSKLSDGLYLVNVLMGNEISLSGTILIK